VQDAGGDGFIVELQIGQDAGDFDGVREIRVTRGAQLAAMRLHRKHISAVQQILVRIGIIGFDAFDKFILAEHFRIVVRSAAKAQALACAGLAQARPAGRRGRSAPNPSDVTARLCRDAFGTRGVKVKEVRGVGKAHASDGFGWRKGQPPRRPEFARVRV